MKKEKVLILGASANKDRYAYKALVKLKQYNHDVVLVNPDVEEIEGQKVISDLTLVTEPVDTLTVYVNPKISQALQDKIKSIKTKRVIFNPGTENAVLAEELKKTGIEVINACTLVMLSTNQF
jgi:uncharacterized protein